MKTKCKACKHVHAKGAQCKATRMMKLGPVLVSVPICDCVVGE